jgi:hypothetical protein
LKEASKALLEIIQHPGIYLGEEGMTLTRRFAEVISS